MNYFKIYEDFIEYCKTVKIRDRMMKRNKDDKRLNKGYIYSEVHHIIPRSLNGSDDKSNLVRLLPEEHLFIHLLRYKVFNTKEDFLALRYMINGFNNNKFKKSNIFNSINKKIKSAYSYLKQNSAEFRKIHGWQTLDGKNRISKARKGTFPMKDKETGEIVGSFTKEHENFLSGKWVHHSYGKVPVVNKETNEKLYIYSDEYQNNKELYKRRGSDNSGKNNSRYLDVDTFKVFEIYENFCKEIGFIVSYETVKRLYDLNLIKTNIKLIDFTAFRQKEIGGHPSNLLIEKNSEMLNMCRKAYSKEIRLKYLNGYKNPLEYLINKFKEKNVKN